MDDELVSERVCGITADMHRYNSYNTKRRPRIRPNDGALSTETL